MTTLLIVIGGIGLLFAVVVFFGSPYVRSHKQPVEAALDLFELKRGDQLLDMGSGDGAVLLAAAKKGARATGYEVNPVLWIVSVWRTRRYRELINIKLGDMWKAPIDAETHNLFVFLDTRFLKRLDSKIIESGAQLKVVSYSYIIPGREVIRTKNGMHLYRYK